MDNRSFFVIFSNDNAYIKSPKVFPSILAGKLESFGNGTANFLFVPQVNINRASFNSKINRLIAGHGPFVIYLHRFGLCSHDRCDDKGDPDHYATGCSLTKPFHFMKPSAENLSTYSENIIQNKRSFVRLMNMMKILSERRHDIIIYNSITQRNR
ncbi:hypothetical protein AVEN_200400-1 [Araneus ventricosus]|uniref:Uncharacterized protein n=1 Tax=Araneus ventricosus TaxID=182803 RepID=A0A4Y2RW31_ARAVE|nr:hypothetical protein AVEN_230410-1 [Araneus ventricosus]GBN79185.1 hypothetical protein AVEN_200400-1 [Araneus ventricosus]